jgi:hypothetical protein
LTNFPAHKYSCLLHDVAFTLGQTMKPPSPRFRTQLSWYVLTLGLLGSHASLFAQDGAADGRGEIMQRMAASHRLSLGGENPVPLTLHPEPIFRWSNPVQGSTDGMVFLWINASEPAAVVGVYPEGQTETYLQEWVSVSTQPLTARFGDEAVWTPQSGGVEWKKISQAEGAATSAPRRLVQMKALAREFAATFVPWVEPDETRKTPLRLLSQPLYRYEAAGAAADSSLVDGAIFAFAQGTDPQVLLLLEARREGAAVNWRYAVARLASGAVEAQHNGATVWSAPKHDFRPDATRPYLLLKDRTP